MTEQTFSGPGVQNNTLNIASRSKKVQMKVETWNMTVKTSTCLRDAAEFQTAMTDREWYKLRLLEGLDNYQLVPIV